MRSAASRLVDAFRRAVSAPAHRVGVDPPGESAADRTASYWTSHNVTGHERFANSAASLEHLHWRNAQYFNYIELMPVSGHDGQVVLDLGCGPGNDLVGLGVFSSPARLVGADVSITALDEARERAALHGLSVELAALPRTSAELPYEDASIDYIHCSGVLHHVADAEASLRECRRLLRPGGEMRVMVYNYESLWVHLYVAYVKQTLEGAYADLDIHSAFARTTDGPECPVSRAYVPADFLRMARDTGFRGEFLGASVSMWEMNLLPRRFEAVMDRRLVREHRDFLLGLELDRLGYPLHRGHHAGIGSCFSLRPA